jgi:hypothetical protein
LDELNKAFSLATAPEPAPISQDDSRDFDTLAKFIDSFCASGSTTVDYKMSKEQDDLLVSAFKSAGESQLLFQNSAKNVTTDTYDPLTRQWKHQPMKFVQQKSRPWLYVHEGTTRYDGLLDAGGGCGGGVGGGGAGDAGGIGVAQMSKPQDASEASARVRRCIDRLKDSPEFPDYFVRPDANRQGFFLPVNKFSIGLKQGVDMLDADCLEFVSQGNWFSVFRYTPKAASAAGPQESIIIKHTPINNTTFKYLLQEKAMMHYLNDRPGSGAETIAVERLDGGFSPLVLWRINPANSQDRFQNDRFIAYQDGGRPLEVQFFNQKLPFEELDLLKIAQDLLKALIYLNRKRVVHRNLNLGTVVYSKPGGAKLIALGHAKYIDRPLPYEDRIRSFEVDVCRCESSLLDSSPQQSSSMLIAPVHASPFPPTTKTKPEDFVHPAAKWAK